MQRVDQLFQKSRVMRSLDFFYLSVGILHELSQDLFTDRTSKACRETVLVLDQQPDIPAPNNLPANWPVAIVRAYEEVHVQKEVLIRYHLEAVGVNQDTVGYSETTAMDQLGLRAYCQHLASARKGLSLKGGFLLMAEAEQTSLVPMLGSPDEFTGIGYLLDHLPKGMLDPYYRRQVTENYEQTAISENLHESVENMAGRAGRFHNWELANALVATACMSWIQFQKVDLNAPKPELVQEPAANALVDKPAGIEVSIKPVDLQDQILLPTGSELAGDYGRGQTPAVHTAEDVGGLPVGEEESRSADKSLLPGGFQRLRQPLTAAEPSPEQAAAQEAFDELSPTEKAAKALGVDPGELEELQAFNKAAEDAGALKKTDMSFNLYERLGDHLKRTSRVRNGSSTVSEASLAGIIAYARSMIDAKYELSYSSLEKLCLVLETDFNELTYAVPALVTAEPQDVADALVTALIYIIDGSNQKVSALAPRRYDDQDHSRFTPFLEPVGDLTDEEVSEILATASLDVAAMDLFRKGQTE